MTLKITQAQADLILENDCIDQEVLDSLDFSEPHAGIVAYGQKTTRAYSQINAIQKPPRFNPAQAATGPGQPTPAPCPRSWLATQRPLAGVWDF